MVEKLLSKIQNHGRDVPFLRGRLHYLTICCYPLLLRYVRDQHIPKEVKFSILVLLISFTINLIANTLLHSNQLYVYRSAYKRIDVASIFLIVSAKTLTLNIHYMKGDSTMAMLTSIQWILTFTGVFWALLFDFCCISKEVRSLMHILVTLPNLYLIQRMYVSGDHLALSGILASYAFSISGAIVFCNEGPHPVKGIFEHHELFHTLIMLSFASLVATNQLVIHSYSI